MRREFPIIWARISTAFATPLIIIVALLYLHDLVKKPAAEIYAFGFAAVGITAALSAICLSTTAPIGTATTVPVLRWAGEHFLHSCLLLIQVLIVAFARDIFSDGNG
jgi:ABC-type Fe3+-siderophore transport system permease subunit